MSKTISYDRGIKVMALGYIIFMLSLVTEAFISVPAIIVIPSFILGMVLMYYPTTRTVDRWYD